MALITGSSAVLAALSGAAWSVVTERTRARHARVAARELRAAEREDASARELRTAFADAQTAVLQLGLTVGISLDMRSSRNARLDGEDLPAQLRLVRTEYLAAKVAIERLWPLCPPERHRKIKELSDAASEAFSYARSVGSPMAAAEKVEVDLQESLRALSDDIFPKP
ncbi:hypothetical protein [Nonomuraea sp. NPDC049158]|uniref:hypothetical protein n=1 Tax=Nonomuraea sp. NPDC049158 TaxID=3155649 RepID=UPI00340BC127